MKPVPLIAHHLRDDTQRILRRQVVPHAIRGEDDNVAVPHAVARHVGLARRFGEVLAAENGVLGLQLRGDFGKLVGGVEGVGLDWGAVGDFAGGEEEEGGVAEAGRLLVWACVKQNESGCRHVLGALQCTCFVCDRQTDCAATRHNSRVGHDRVKRCLQQR